MVRGSRREADSVSISRLVAHSSRRQSESRPLSAGECWLAGRQSPSRPVLVGRRLPVRYQGFSLRAQLYAARCGALSASGLGPRGAATTHPAARARAVDSR